MHRLPAPPSPPPRVIVAAVVLVLGPAGCTGEEQTVGDAEQSVKEDAEMLADVLEPLCERKSTCPAPLALLRALLNITKTKNKLISISACAIINTALLLSLSIFFFLLLLHISSLLRSLCVLYQLYYYKFALSFVSFSYTFFSPFPTHLSALRFLPLASEVDGPRQPLRAGVHAAGADARAGGREQGGVLQGAPFQVFLCVANEEHGVWAWVAPEYEAETHRGEEPCKQG